MKDLLLDEDKKLGNKITTNAKEILLLTDGANTSEDLNMIEMLCGSNSPLVKANKELGKKMELEIYNKKFNGDVISKNAIKNLVLKYNLRLSSTKEYKGMLGFEAINEIKKFSEETNTNVSSIILDRKFFILTSEKSLKGKKKDVTFLLYKIDEDVFKIIHTWGSLPNKLFNLKAFIFKSEENLVSFSALATGLFAFLLFVYFNTFEQMKAGYCWKMWGPTLVGIMLGTLISALYCTEIEKEKKNKLFSENYWKKNWEY